MHCLFLQLSQSNLILEIHFYMKTRNSRWKSASWLTCQIFDHNPNDDDIVILCVTLSWDYTWFFPCIDKLHYTYLHKTTINKDSRSSDDQRGAASNLCVKLRINIQTHVKCTLYLISMWLLFYYFLGEIKKNWALLCDRDQRVSNSDLYSLGLLVTLLFKIVHQMDFIALSESKIFVRNLYCGLWIWLTINFNRNSNLSQYLFGKKAYRRN